jgi:hypothetical protein
VLFLLCIETTIDIYMLTGTLSFITYYLLKNPDVMRKLRDEIDEVIGMKQPQYEHLNKLPYLIGGIGIPFSIKGS